MTTLQTVQSSVLFVCSLLTLQVVSLHQLGNVLASQAKGLSNADDVIDATHGLQITTKP